ncbi:MAG: type III pantothenate kinase [Candidatus Eisenbacteria sp.]|nr:type III pantothenate kinase [Candidatus Eisenbacteria bacterium]
MFELSTMTLTIDVGNTETHIGLFREDVLEKDWRLATHPIRTSDEFARELAGFLDSEGVAWKDLAGVVLGSVVPAATSVVEETARLRLRKEPVTVHAGLGMPIEICTRDPHQVGADRIANAVAGCLWREPPVIVVDLGTATTLDVIASGARYIGGVICPGVVASVEELVKRTAKLPSVEMREPERVIGRDTEECMRSGIIYGTASQIDGLISRVRDELGSSCPAIVTGGWAPTIAPFCANVEEVDRHLTLKGLKVLYDLNC